MITLLSDLHGTLPEELLSCTQNAGGEDLLILLGDTGLWFPEADDWEAFTERFLSLPAQIALVEGNHENFRKLAGLPKEEWHGGSVRRVNDRIVVLERGEIYTVEGKTLFAMGGCASSAKWRERGLWQPEEAVTPEQCRHAVERLQAQGGRVDYILSHYYYFRRGKYLMDPASPDYPLQQLCGYIDGNVSFRQWFMGHWHEDRQIDEKHRTVFREPVVLND